MIKTYLLLLLQLKGISIIIIILLFLFLFCLFMTLIVKDKLKKSNDIYQYKINFYFFNILYALLYIVVFILLIYFVRIYNMYFILDLKELYRSFYLFFQKSFLHLISILLIISMLLYLFLTIILYIELTFNIIFLKLHIYYEGKNPLYMIITGKLKRYNMSNDIINYYIIKIFYHLSKMRYANKITDNCFDFICKLCNNKYYLILINYSPIFIILYDCFFNNWVLVHIYFFMLLYMPVAVLRRFTHKVAHIEPYMLYLLYDIYYKQENVFYFIHKAYFDLVLNYIKNQLRCNMSLLHKELEITFLIYSNKEFMLINKEKNIYLNNEGRYIIQKGLKYFELLEDDIISKEDEWILIQQKFNS